jgi:predicted cobalt transporter CbtA
MIVAFLAMPSNPDKVTAPMDLVSNFRIASALTMSAFWGVLGIVLGLFWDRLRLDEAAKVTA